MLDIHLHGSDYPDEPLAIGPHTRWLCLAPHPDDEVIACAGTLMLAAQAGASVHTVVLTDGAQAQGDQASPHTRQEESCQAAQVMDLPPPQFLIYADRELRFGTGLTTQIQDLLERHQPTHLIVPALSEPHPDHQALALAATQASLQASLEQNLLILYAEIGSPTQPNTLVDISTVAERKWLAMACFASQEAVHPYLRHTQALGTLRALGKGPACSAAEAFWQVPLDQLRTNGWSATFPYWPLQRSALGLARAGSELPLVNILIRSMGRKSLDEALASVAAQTYPNLEVIVVNASAQPHPAISWPAQRLQLRLIDRQQALPRSQAANLALQHINAALALFLDDDDLIEPGHIAKLVDALQAQPQAIAAYTGVRVVNEKGETVRTYDVPWAAQRLAAINFLPIHGVLFRTWPCQQTQLQFDEQLPVLEDWDFWYRLSAHGPMVHVQGCTGIYRQSLGQSNLSLQDHPHHWRLWHHNILHQRVASASQDQLLDWLSWHALSLDREQALHQQLLDHYARREQEHQRLAQDLQTARQNHQQLLDQYAKREQEHQHLAHELASVLSQNRDWLTQLEQGQQRHLFQTQALEQLTEQHNALVDLYGQREAHHEQRHAHAQHLVKQLQHQLQALRESRWVRLGAQIGALRADLPKA